MASLYHYYFEDSTMCQYCLHYSVEDATSCALNTLGAEFDSVSLADGEILARRAGSNDVTYRLVELGLATPEEEHAMLIEMFGEVTDNDR